MLAKKIVNILALRISLLIAISTVIIMSLIVKFRLLPNYFWQALFDSALTGLIVFYFLRYYLIFPLRKIFTAVDAIGRGDVDVSIEIVRPYEMHLIAEEINRSLAGLKERHQEIYDTAEVLISITNNIDDAIMLIDNEFKVVWANKKIMALSGLPEKDVFGHYCYKITHRLDDKCQPPHDICPITEVLKKGQRVTVLHTHYDKEGNPFYVEVTAYPLLGKDGKIKEFIHIAHNVTDKVRMINELRESKAKLEEYSRSLEEVVSVRTKDLRKGIEESEEQRQAIMNILEDMNRAHKELAKVNLELKQAQAQVVQTSKMAALGQLAGGVAHEINNPLTGVLNNAQLIKMLAQEKREFNLDEFKELLDVIEESALRCKNITQTLLDFSHISRGVFKPISLTALTKQVLTLIKYEIKLQNVSIDEELDPSLPEILGDGQLLQQVIFNFISNAKWAVQKRFNNEGGMIIIKTGYDKEKNLVYLSVRDNGVGIPRENREKIFEPFFTTKTIGEGTGLGLSVVYNIIKTHKGEVKLESEINQGTTFTIFFPPLSPAGTKE